MSEEGDLQCEDTGRNGLVLHLKSPIKMADCFLRAASVQGPQINEQNIL